jgi:putative oxidoreductase
VKVAWERVSNITLWIAQGALAALFLYFGASKSNGHESFWVNLFGEIGFGQWFRYFTGSLEMTCGVLLLIPRTSAIAALLLAGTIVGAVLTHLLLLCDGYGCFFPSFPLVILTAIAWRRMFAAH